MNEPYIIQLDYEGGLYAVKYKDANVDIQIPYYCHGYKREDQQEKECAFKRMEAEIDKYYANSRLGVYKYPIGHLYEEGKRFAYYPSGYMHEESK